METTELNPYEIQARHRKANILATALETLGLNSEDVDNYKAWDTLSMFAYVNAPSAETIATIKEILYDRQATRGRFAGMRKA